MVLAITGYTGQGIETAGEMLLELLARQGRRFRAWRDFSTIIRGGLTAFEVYLGPSGTAEAPWRRTPVDVVAGWDDAALAAYRDRVRPEAVYGGKKAAGVPAVRQTDAPAVGFNVWALGLLARAAGVPRDALVAAVLRRFGDGPNRAWAEAGYEAFAGPVAGAEAGPDTVVLSGNDALSLGAVAGGVRFYCGYPITPASDILENLARWLPALGGVTYQVEDEIAAIHMAVGASFAGQRTFVATSGPGASLMTEGLGWAATVEVPLVLVDNQRGGPSTGMPTKVEQSDWLHLAHAGHGEFPRIVLAPTGVLDSLVVMQEALNLADRYQCPVLLGLDLDLAVRRIGVPWAAVAAHLAAVPPDRGRTLLPPTRAPEDFRRFVSPDGDGPWRPVPGVRGGAYVASGDEHDERGWMEPDFRVVRPRLHWRRLTKTRTLAYPRPVTEVGAEDAPVVLVATGAVSELVYGAVEADPARFRGVLVRQIVPAPVDALRAALRRAEAVVVAEYNATGQLEELLGPAFDAVRPRALRRFDGEHWTLDEFLGRLEQLDLPGARPAGLAGAR
ncbi:MAG: 2-oxoacid:acceptor oxidoreductase family protein [Actinomycetia bacterium]|nr:2-oxoacid:acceptor oxidoreductase family protein [Actinomycetes bacterium]